MTGKNTGLASDHSLQECETAGNDHGLPGAERIVIVGFGNIGQAVTPLLQTTFPDRNITAIDCCIDMRRAGIARERGIALIQRRIDADNYSSILTPWLKQGDFLLNLAPSVHSGSLLQLAQARGAIYLDTGVEPWEYHYGDAPVDTSNYALREEVLALKRAQSASPVPLPTAIVAHGANPGYVSALVKQGLLRMAREAGLLSQQQRLATPHSREDWAKLAAALDIQVIQISECDTQSAPMRRAPNEFVNTWSVPGFMTECRQDVELGWGTHEPVLPAGGTRYEHGCGAAIRIPQPGWATTVKSWTPQQGEFEAYVLTHHESISIADYLTLGPPQAATYRPTVYYAYRPTELTIESMALLHAEPELTIIERLLKDDITEGIDELGVFLMSGRYPSLWLGSALSIERARMLAPYNNATSLQVASAVVGALKWAEAHPREGIVESDEIDHEAMLEYAAQYWAPMQCNFTDWKPASGLSRLAFGAFATQYGGGGTARAAA